LRYTYFQCFHLSAALPLILPFECYTYFQYCHLSATLTFNAVIWVLHLLLILPFECYTYF
jgi:hypothetical protein